MCKRERVRVFHNPSWRFWVGFLTCRVFAPVLDSMAIGEIFVIYRRSIVPGFSPSPIPLPSTARELIDFYGVSVVLDNS